VTEFAAEGGNAMPERAFLEALELAGGVAYRLNTQAGVFEFVGAGLETLLGVAAADFTPARFEAMVLERRAVEPEGITDFAALDAAFAGGAIPRVRLDVALQTPSGGQKWIRDHYAPLRDSENGRVIGRIGAFVDLTAMRQAEAEAQQSQEDIRDLHRIAADPKKHFREKLQILLEKGCQRYGLEMGILSRVEGERYTVQAVAPADKGIAPGAVFDLGGTYCSQTLRSEVPVRFERAGETEWRTHPAYKAFRLEAYLGTRVMAGKRV